MRTAIGLVATAIAVATIGSAAASADGAYVVIVHPDNPMAAASKSDLRQFFLKRTKEWAHGGAVNAVDQKLSSKVRQAFTKEVLGRSTSAIKAYWLRNIYSGRDLPPAEKGSDTDVVEYVSKNPGAIGYVTASANTAAVKALKLTD